MSVLEPSPFYLARNSTVSRSGRETEVSLPLPSRGTPFKYARQLLARHARASPLLPLHSTRLLTCFFSRWRFTTTICTQKQQQQSFLLYSLVNVDCQKGRSIPISCNNSFLQNFMQPRRISWEIQRTFLKENRF